MTYLVKSSTISANEDTAKAISDVGLATSNHAFGFTPLLDRFDPDNFQIIDTGTINRADVPAVQDYLDNLISGGLVDNGRVFKPIFAGSSNQRNGEFVVCWDKVWNEVFQWCTCGLDTHKLTSGKIAKYAALMMSTVRSWNSVFPDGGDYGLMSYPEIENWGVFNDIGVPAFGVFDKVTPWTSNRELVLPGDGETNKITDGVSYYIVDDTKMNSVASRRFARNAEAFTVRAPFIKGLMVPIMKSSLIRFFTEHNISPVVKDAWGKEQNIVDLKVITFKSVFKAAKCVSSWQEYVDAFRAYDHKIWICVKAHGHKWASLPYQQMQTLDLTDGEILDLFKLSSSVLMDNAVPGKAGKIVGGALGKVMDLCPSILSDQFVRDSLQRSWISKAKAIFGGRILQVSHNLFCAPDTVAVLEGLTEQTISGSIAANHVITSVFEAGKELGCTRCPHLDHAWVTPTNIVASDPGLYTGTTIYYSALDNSMKIHQMDFDGDHSNVTDNLILINAAKRSKVKYMNECLLYAAMDSGAVKGCEDYVNEFNLLCRNAFKAPIGLYANALTKIWATRVVNYNAVSKKINCTTRKTNTCIDEAGGHGKDASSGVAEDVVKNLRLVEKPAFLKYAKGAVADSGDKIMPAKGKFKVYASSVVDRYSALARFVIPQKAEDVIDLSGVERFDCRSIMSNPQLGDRRMKLMDLIGLKDGLFNRLCRSVVSESELIAKSSSSKAVPNFKMDKSDEINLEVADFAMDRGLTLDDAIDVIAYTLFYKIKNGTWFVSQMKRWFFIAFGDRLVENARHNAGIAFVEAGYDELDPEDDESDMDE